LVLAAVVILIFSIVGLRFRSLGTISPVEQVFVDISGFVQKGLSGPLRWSQEIWRSYIALQDVRVENEALRTEVDRLKSDITCYREALIANARFKRLLDIKEETKTPTVAANVVGVDIAPWVATLTVNRGSKDGVGPGMVVLGGAGVLGQVVDSALYFSKVLLLSDSNSAVSAIIQRNRVQGILKGVGSGKSRLVYVDKEADVEVGDAVVTSGLDGVFPKGLLLGEVNAVEDGPVSDLFQMVGVTPVVDLQRVEEVLILKKGRSFVETTD
jgi:rod shape-determining protein MreC